MNNRYSGNSSYNRDDKRYSNRDDKRDDKKKDDMSKEQKFRIWEYLLTKKE